MGSFRGPVWQGWQLYLPDGWECAESEEELEQKEEEPGDFNDDDAESGISFVASVSEDFELFVEGYVSVDPITDEQLQLQSDDFVEMGLSPTAAICGRYDGVYFDHIDDDGDFSRTWFLRCGTYSAFVNFTCMPANREAGLAAVQPLMETLQPAQRFPQSHRLIEGEENHRRFMKRAIEKGEVYCLEDPERGILSVLSHHEEQSVLPFWSDAAYARRARTAEPGGLLAYHVMRYPLTVFLHQLLPEFIDAGVLIGPNYTADLAGREVEPRELLFELTQAKSPR